MCRDVKILVGNQFLINRSTMNSVIPHLKQCPSFHLDIYELAQISFLKYPLACSTTRSTVGSCLRMKRRCDLNHPPPFAPLFSADIKKVQHPDSHDPQTFPPFFRQQRKPNTRRELDTRRKTYGLTHSFQTLPSE